MVKELNERFGLEGVLQFDVDEHGLERATIKEVDPPISVDPLVSKVDEQAEKS